MELTLIKSENHIKVLENKIEIYTATNVHSANDNLIEVWLINCINYKLLILKL